MHGFSALSSGLLLAAAMFWVNLHADPVPVRHPQGSAHGFLALRTLEGTRIATGDVTQVVHGDRVISRLIFRFRDGSIDDDMTVFSQRGTFGSSAIITSNAGRPFLNRWIFSLTR